MTAWSLPRRALADPHVAAAREFDERLAELATPWALPLERLPLVAPVAFGLGWEPLDDQPTSVQRRLREALAHAAALAARLRLHATFDWLLTAAQAPVPADDATLLRAVAQLAPDAGPAGDDLAAALTALSRLRRYGPDEDDVAWRLAAAVNRPRPVSQPALWVWERLHEAAVWLTLIHGKADAARRYLDRCPAVAETWLGWLATGRRDSPLALRARHGSWTLWRQAELSHAVTAPLRHDRGEPDAVAWWRAETAGWDLVLSPPEQWPQRLRETGPAILSGAPTR